MCLDSFIWPIPGGRQRGAGGLWVAGRDATDTSEKSVANELKINK